MDNYGNGFGSRQKVSSNSFACGNNQNSGNILCDTPSTRVARPPGGASTFSFGWDEGRPKKTQPPSPVSNNSINAGCAANQRSSPQPGSAAGMVGAHKGSNGFACGTNQNCGNAISDISSTRINKPPGGSSSLNLGWGDGQVSSPERSHCPAGARSPSSVSVSLSDGYPTSPRKSQQQTRCLGGSPMPMYSAAGGSAGGAPDGPWPSSPSSDHSAGCSPRSRCPPNGDDLHSAFGVRPRVTSNSYASGGSQNNGNVLTGVPTTRVSKPPGGKSAVCLSWEEGSSHAPRGNSACSQMHHPASPQMQSSGGHASTRSPTASQTTFAVRPRITSNTFACGADQNCGNFISDTPSTRVNRPPGVASSLSLAWN